MTSDAAKSNDLAAQHRWSVPVPAAPVLSLYKQNSWSPDACRKEAWKRRKGSHCVGIRRSKSVTEEDMKELKGCIELGFGFGFDSPEIDQRLSNTLPAYALYYAVNKQYKNAVCMETSSSSSSDCESPSPDTLFLGPGKFYFGLGEGENPEMVKTRLRQWAQVVAFLVRQSSF